MVLYLEDWEIVANFAAQNRKGCASGGYQSGQMGQTVNLLVYTFGGSNPSPPTLDINSIIAHNNYKERVREVPLFVVFYAKDTPLTKIYNAERKRTSAN